MPRRPPANLSVTAVPLLLDDPGARTERYARIAELGVPPFLHNPDACGRSFRLDLTFH